VLGKRQNTLIPWEREKESDMDTRKFAQMVREFPFLSKIFADANLSADSIGNIEVKRGDRNLLEVKPTSWCHDADSWGEHSGHRLFWCVSPGELMPLKASWQRTQVPHGTTGYESTEQIGAQLLDLSRDVHFIVEVHEEHWDWEEQISDVTIYKMQGFDWRHFCRPVQVAQS